MAHAIFMVFDDHYARYATNCLLSLRKNYPAHPEVLVFYDGADPDVIAFLAAAPNVTVLPFQFDFLDLEGLDLGTIDSPKIYFRYLLWTGYFDAYDTIVHLDADTIVLQPFDELFGKEEFFAVADYTPFELTLFRNEHYQDPELTGRLAADNLPGPPQAFQMINAGVFAIPRKYRVREQFEELVRLNRRYNAFTDFADQASISLWCYRNHIPVSKEIGFNFQASFFCKLSSVLAEQIENGFSTAQIRIFHFTWWKPHSVFYREFLETVRFMTAFDQTYVTGLSSVPAGLAPASPPAPPVPPLLPHAHN